MYVDFQDKIWEQKAPVEMQGEIKSAGLDELGL